MGNTMCHVNYNCGCTKNHRTGTVRELRMSSTIKHQSIPVHCQKIKINDIDNESMEEVYKLNKLPIHMYENKKNYVGLQDSDYSTDIDIEDSVAVRIGERNPSMSSTESKISF